MTPEAAAEIAVKPSPAQVAKARRYLALGLVRHTGTGTSEIVGWGEPSTTTETYEVHPLPGSKDVHRVQVIERHDGAGGLISATYSCDCQRSDKLHKDCSHIVAVRSQRTGRPPE